jgi:hypothetical protein
VIEFHILGTTSGDLTMSQTTKLLTVSLDSEAAVAKVIQHLSEDGLQVVRSFDLKTARSAHQHCVCNYHGTEQCDCQMIVLLVYEGQGQPLTMVVHSRNSQTQIEMVDTPQQRPGWHLKATILRALASERSASSQ